MLDIIKINSSSQNEFDEMTDLIKPIIGEYKFDQYYNYSTRNKNAWKSYLVSRLQVFADNDESTLFLCKDEGEIYIIGCRIPKWDEDIFGFKVAVITSIFHSTVVSNFKLQKALKHILNFLENKNVKFISIIVHGDDLEILHAFEDCHFRYYEDIIWPIKNLKNHHTEKINGLTMMKNEYLEEVQQIAKKSHYPRGHFLCDKKFPVKVVNNLYSKWIKTAWLNYDPIVIIKKGREIAGCFIVNIDKELEKHLGYKYGKMISLAVDDKFRGMGLGSKLFRGAIDVLNEMESQMIVSGYSSKNHPSAKLHVANNFNSVYEGVRLHKWL